MHVAARIGNPECMKILIDNGAKTDSQDKKLSTPMHGAAERNCVVCMNYLIDSGANMELGDHVRSDLT